MILAAFTACMPFAGHADKLDKTRLSAGPADLANTITPVGETVI
jgi:hypothetical protein